jgi:hypothetical protein
MVVRSLFSKTAAFALGCVALTASSHGAPAEPAPQAPGKAAPASPLPATPAPAKPVEISFIVHKTMDVNPEGPEFARSYFTAGNQRIAFGLPKGVRLSVGDGFILVPVEGSFDGEIHVNRSPFGTDFDLAENALKYREAGAREIPKGATDVQVQQPALDTYPFNGWKSIGFTWTYTSFGRPMVRTVNYINLDVGAQIIVTTLAAKKDAEKVDKAAKQFIGTWWMMPDKVTPAAPIITQ